MESSRSRTAKLLCGGLMLGYGGVYAVLALLRLRHFHAQIDMSYYLRLIWGAGHGRWDHPLVQAPHALGLHLEPVLLPLAALSALGVPLAAVLLVLQAFAVALLAWPAARLATRVGAPGGGPLWGALALVYPTVTVQTLFDFHPVTLALAPLLSALDALHEGRPRRALIFGALALGCREDIALQLALTFLFAPRAPRWLRFLVPALLCGYFAAYVLWIQPPLLPRVGSYGLHFPRLGGVTAHSGPELLRAALAHPLDLLRYLVSGDRLVYAPRLLWPLGFLGLLAPRYLMGALPIVAINLLSDFPRVRALESHYATAIVPFVIAASIIGMASGAERLRPFGGRLRCLLLGGTVLCSLWAHVTHGASPLAITSPRWAALRFAPSARESELRAALQAVPAGASVAAPPGLLAHLAERPRILSPPEYDDGRPVDVRLMLQP